MRKSKKLTNHMANVKGVIYVHIHHARYMISNPAHQVFLLRFKDRLCDLEFAQNFFLNYIYNIYI